MEVHVSFCLLLRATFDVNEWKKKLFYQDKMGLPNTFSSFANLRIVVEGGLYPIYTCLLMVSLALVVNKKQENIRHNMYMNEILKNCVFHLIREQLGIKIECGCTCRGELREVLQNIFHLPCIVDEKNDDVYFLCFCYDELRIKIDLRLCVCMILHG